MARKKKTAAKKTGPTYYKAKNGRFYKKVVIDGKTRCRFVSNAEATGTVKPKSGTKSQRKATKPKQKQKQKEPEPEPEDAPLVEG